MKTTLARIQLGLLAAFCATMMVAPAGAQDVPGVAGTWTARNVRQSGSAPFSVFLELQQRGDSVSGRLYTESNRGEPGIDVRVFGHIVSDSLFLADAQRVPMVAAKISDAFLNGRMAMSRGRMGRGVPDLQTLGPSARSVRFVRSAR